MATLEDVQSHYDVGNDFFNLFLDRKYRVYSCAVWEEAKTLEEAQEKKLARIASFANIKSGQRFLDVGCGWGGMMGYALEYLNVRHAVGLTLSEEQYKFIKMQNLRNVEVHLRSWADFDSETKFDAIVSIGAFEHFASLEDRAKGRQISVYKSFFERCHYLSCENSSLALQTIVTEKKPSTLQSVRDTRFLLNHVFPGSALPFINDIQAAILDLYEIHELRTIGQDYAMTLTHWKNRLLQHQSQIIEMYGQHLFDNYTNYFDAARRSFDKGVVNLVQVSLKRKNR